MLPDHQTAVMGYRVRGAHGLIHVGILTGCRLRVAKSTEQTRFLMNRLQTPRFALSALLTVAVAAIVFAQQPKAPPTAKAPAANTPATPKAQATAKAQVSQQACRAVNSKFDKGVLASWNSKKHKKQKAWRECSTAERG